jgi:hypothetical protein
MQLEPIQSMQQRSGSTASAARDFRPPRKLLLHRTLQLLTTVLIVDLSACRFGKFDSDTVLPGDYGATQSGSGGARALTPNPSAGSPAGQAGNTATSPIATTAGSAPVSATGVSGAIGVSGVAGTAGVASAANSSGTPMAGGSSAVSQMAGTGATMPAGPCDLSGRWLSTVRTVTDALGQQQIARSYVYYEIAQQGDAFTVSKGIDRE